MKTFKFVAVVFMFMFGLGSAQVLFAQEASKVASDHLEMAARYEQQASEQAALIQEHTAMKQDYKSRFYINEKLTPMGQFQEMEKHCNNIIDQAQKTQADLLELAKWHRMRAAELQGQ